MKEKAILAYSGGLIQQQLFHGLKRILIMKLSVSASICGQGEELDGLEERAKFCGASKLYIEDVVDEFL